MIAKNRTIYKSLDRLNFILCGEKELFAAPPHYGTQVSNYAAKLMKIEFLNKKKLQSVFYFFVFLYENVL